MNSAKVIIFDFDGTLADSSALIRSVYNELAAQYGLPRVDEADYQRMRGLSFSQFQQWAGVKTWQIPGLMREGLKRFRSQSAGIELFEGMPQLIRRLNAEDKTLYILSTNSPQTIKEVLNRYEIADMITTLRRSALFGKHYAIRHLMSRHKYVPENIWMIGDEVRDIEAAKRAGVNCAAVSWGLQTAHLLKAANPQALASKPSELFGILTT